MRLSNGPENKWNEKYISGIEAKEQIQEAILK